MKKKSINELSLNKEIVTKFNKKNVNGGKIDPTYTNVASPMTSCNGKCCPTDACPAEPGC